jgi:hypothetical protein
MDVRASGDVWSLAAIVISVISILVDGGIYGTVSQNESTSVVIVTKNALRCLSFHYVRHASLLFLAYVRDSYFLLRVPYTCLTGVSEQKEVYIAEAILPELRWSELCPCHT